MTTSTPAANTISVDIVSDTVCPWCYIGKRRLEKAIDLVKQKHPDANFKINWHPYQLDPSAPTTPIKKIDMYKRKFGPDRAYQIKDRMIQIGLGDGIHFAYEGNTINTLMSHRLIRFATERGHQDAIVEELFKNYFEENKCGELSTLIEAGVKVGLDRKEVEEYLTSDKGTEEVKREIAQARYDGVQGVPHFTIQDKYVLSGAQDSTTFAEVFERVLKEQK
ncbi:hypothetical protein BGW42_006855 [Actinomortierella wolfii]|nr:hypothetical protein BGW42_006855 [Actinomortierella wolfii]KAG0240548.1 hypothetical protein BGW41_006943 [Actinomortierella wolfii]